MKPQSEMDIDRMARKKGFWIKLTSEGTYCLMRAVSNALYFSETCHESIQSAIFIYFKSQLENGKNDLMLHQDSISLFTQTPFLPEFEKVNLEIISRLYHVSVNVYSSEIDLLYNVIDPDLSGRQIHIIRLGDTHYASLERLERATTLILAQNVILSAIESVAEKSEFQLNDYNKGRLINFDYLHWRLNSGLLELKGDAIQVDYRQNLYVNRSAELDVSNSVSEKGSSIGNSKDYSVGSVIVSIMKARQKQNAQWQPSSSFERKCEQLLNSSDYTNSLKEGHGEMSINNPKAEGGLAGRKFELDFDDPDSDDSQLNKFSSMIYGTNNNLSKSVSILRLNNIFQFPGKKNETAMVPEDLIVDFPDEADAENKSMSDHRDLEFELVWNNAGSDVIEPPQQLKRNTNLPRKLTKTSGDNLDDAFQIVQKPIKNRISCKSAESKEEPLNKPEIEADFHLHVSSSNLHPNHDWMPYNSGPNYISSQKSHNKPSQMNSHRIQHQDSDQRNPYIQNCYVHQNQIKPHFDGSPYTPLHQKTVPKDHQDMPGQHPEQPISSKKGQQGKKNKTRYREKQSNTVYTGILKFFDEKNGFGFVTSIDKFCDSFDVFIYQNEFKRAKIDMDTIRLAKKKAILTFQFQTATYTGKNSASKKAVNVQLIDVKLPTN